jgi:protein kinase A
MGTCSSSSTAHTSSNVAIPKQNQNNPGTNDNLESNQSQNQIDAYLEHAKQQFEIKYAQQSTEKIILQDFQLQRTIGTGSFATVMLVKHGSQSLALKIMEKEPIFQRNQIEHILSEKHILQAINCPFIVSLVYAFKDNSYLYLALEFVSGGDMFSHLR